MLEPPFLAAEVAGLGHATEVHNRIGLDICLGLHALLGRIMSTL